MKKPYDVCPEFETKSFVLRLVSENDAEDLLVCYSDPKAQAVFDSDNFISNLWYKTVDEMADCIRFWLAEYKQQRYVRFSIVDKTTKKAVGTVEMFKIKEHLNDYSDGVLRIDIASEYETTAYISEILNIANTEFYTLFEIEFIVMKGRPVERSRVCALVAAGYSPYSWNNPDRKYYYGRPKFTRT